MAELSESEGGAILRVLLVEANARDGQRLLAALRGGGHTVYSRQAVSLEDVREALSSETWDIALLSCALIEATNEGLLDLMVERCPTLPVILTIERGSKLFPIELLEKGASDFVFKSNPSRLLPVVERECTRLLLDRAPGLSDLKPTVDTVEMRFLQLAGNVPECYWLSDAASGRITFVSKGYEQIWGRYVEALYADAQDWIKHVHAEDQARLTQAFRQHRQGGLNERFRTVRPDGTIRWLQVRTFPVHNDSGEVVSIGGVASDITRLHGNLRQLPFFAHFDALTALPNQLMFYDQARHLIALAKRTKLSVGVMVVDIDHFRQVNQTLGHTSGDELLRQVAARLSGSLRESDILGRIGGDVFAVLLPATPDTVQAAAVARRVIETLILPVRVEGQDVFATASVGMAFFPADGDDAHELISHAEVAVRQAKSQGRNGYQFYSARLHDDIRERLLMETDLRNATLRNEFVLHYQPKVSCANGRMTGAEALIRWKHPRRGIVPPDQFIPLLEETGLIVQVGRWVLQEACRQTVAWQQAGLTVPSVSVNLSARQLLSDTLLDDIAEILAATGLKPACLDLEITESMLMQNAEMAVRTLFALKEMGVTISLDDFGTGYSSLAYLKRFPLDAVKVDRSFVQDIAADSDDASITRAVITMAHHLKLKVVAEGVETAAQLALLISHQCDIIQGYFFSRPLAVDEMTALLGEEKCLPDSLLRTGLRKPMVLFVSVDGCDQVIAELVRNGHRVCVAQDAEGAMQWFDGNLVDVLVCGAPRKDFDAAALIQRVAAIQPMCERILLADGRQWNRKPVTGLSSSGLVQRVVHLPFETTAFRLIVEDALARRHLSEDYTRLSQEVEQAERELIRVEEARRRLELENRTLQATESEGYRILQEVIAALPYPVFGFDNEGMLVMLNDAAAGCCPGEEGVIGASIEQVLHGLGIRFDNENIVINNKAYRCCWRAIQLGSRHDGRLLLLERV